MDIGKPVDYLKGTYLHLDSIKNEQSKIDNEEWEFDAKLNILKHKTSLIGKNCCIGKNMVIGKNVVIEDDESTKMTCSVLLDNVQVKKGVDISDSIIGWDCVIGENSIIKNFSVLERDVHVEPKLTLNGATVCSHKTIKENILQPQIIL